MLESELIKQITRILGSESAKYIGDDCAVVNSTDLLANLGSTDSLAKLLFSADTLNEDVHFSTDIFSPYQIGWKAAAVNISDICAMAGQPLYMLVNLSLPMTGGALSAKLGSLILHDEKFTNLLEDFQKQNLSKHEIWVASFYQGIKDCAERYGSPIVIGGDLTCSEKISVTINIIGRSSSQSSFLRSEAKPGYKVCVTGKFGNARSFLDQYLRFRADQYELSKIINETKLKKADDYKYFFTPSPRYKEAFALNKLFEKSALMDSSDGLAHTLHEIAKQSAVKITIDSSKIPKDKHVSLEQALYGGEDFELVGCFPETPEGFIYIGNIELGEGVFNELGKPLLNSCSFEHFEPGKNH